MLVTVDVGNTQTDVGVYATLEDNDPIVTWRIASQKTDASGDIEAKLTSLFAGVGLMREDVTCVCMASVVPTLQNSWRDAMCELYSVEPLLCNARLGMELGLFKTTYDKPEEIGADRIADAIALRAIYGAPSIVVDFGTATNIEAIDCEGSFVGGVIAPGIMTSAQSLISNASRLAAIEMKAPDCVIGRNTEEAMQSGIIFGEASKADGLIERVKAELCEISLKKERDKSEFACSVIATGGLAQTIAAHSLEITHVDMKLTLTGLRLMARAYKEA